ncbi:MAG: hypothetical protein HY738_12780, partial [Bacteroidia bacterium]|nr:hypothetical protein [Bacteroidia bacterium]
KYKKIFFAFDYKYKEVKYEEKVNSYYLSQETMTIYHFKEVSAVHFSTGFRFVFSGNIMLETYWGMGIRTKRMYSSEYSNKLLAKTGNKTYDELPDIKAGIRIGVAF